MIAPERTPVLAGVAQLEQRVFDPTAVKEPLDLMVEAVREAALDAGAKSLLQAATSVRVIFCMWPYQNPARVVADRVGISGVETVLLALFPEMMKGKPWTAATLREVGGTSGVGVTFLEETFSSRTANPKHATILKGWQRLAFSAVFIGFAIACWFAWLGMPPD